MTLPELDGLDATAQLVDISVTERGQFRQCRRRWNLDTIENLEPRTYDGLQFVFGTGIHSALEALNTAATKQVGEQDARDIWTDWRNDQESEAENQDEYERRFNVGELGEQMLEHYFEFDRVAKVQLGRPLAVEGRMVETGLFLPHRPSGYPPEAEVKLHPSGRLMVPIVDPLSKMPLVDKNGRVPHLTMRIDLLTERATPKLGLWVVDNKTASSPPRDKALDLDDQATGYCYGVFRWLGRLPRGVIWNVLLKEVPEEPRIVQDKRKGRRGEETLSSAKSQLTLPSMYREALKEWGYMDNGRITSEDHAKCLNALLARGWDPFFRRYELIRNEHEINSFERRLIQEYWDMADCYEDADRLYPNPHTMHCPGCPVQRICLAMEDGSDWEDVIERHFVVGPDRKSQR